MSRYNKYLKIIGLILFIYILLRIDFSELTAAFKDINPIYYFAGFLFLILGQFIRALRWKRLINFIKVRIPNRILAKMMTMGIFWGVITPGKVGELWRAKYLIEITQVFRKDAFYIAVADRLIDLLVVVIVSVGWLMAFGGKWFLPALFLRDFRTTAVNLNFKLFLELLGYGFSYYLNVIIAYYFIALSLGIPLPFWYLFFSTAAVLFFLILPVTFLGLGVREAGFIYFFSLIGISSSLAVSFSLLIMSYSILLALPGAILLLWTKK